jgi:lysyl-tRNA synthetase class 2
MTEENPQSNLMLSLSQSNVEKQTHLRHAGINPYPYQFSVTHAPEEIRQQFQKLVESQEIVAVASRVMSQRLAGKSLVFLDLASTAEHMRTDRKIQIMIRQDEIEAESWIVVENLSLGDWIGVNGKCLFTRAGEPTIQATKITMLSKTLRPIPIPKVYSTEQGAVKDAHTIQDLDTLWRYPEIDMLVRRKAEVLVARAYILNAVRRTLINEFGCIELETPYLNIFFGGAEATPFTTKIRALDQEVYLAISPEIELKRAVVGGLGTGGVMGRGVFSIARNFRNEGVDRTHNPEFTSMEVYIPFVDFKFMMQVTERIFAQACHDVHGSLQCNYNGQTLDFDKPWPQISMTRMVSEKSGIDVENWDIDLIRNEIKNRELQIDQSLDSLDLNSPATKRKLIRRLEQTQIAHCYPDYVRLDAEQLLSIVLRHKLHKAILPEQAWDYLVLDLFEIYCEPFLNEPCHVILHPAKSTVLCKQYRAGPLPNGQVLIERFESFVMGMELSNAYSELNDPVIQRHLIEEQAHLREGGREDAMPYNESFLRSIEMGLPPCGGLGIGIDRMVMLLTDSRSIRDVIAFPMVGRET